MQEALARKTMLEIAAGYEQLAGYASTGYHEGQATQ
jgi:hypothetical protein